MITKQKLIRITTVPGSLRSLLKGQLNYMSKYFDVIGISSEGEAIEDVIKNEEVKLIPLEMTRTISPVKDLKSVIKLYFILKKEKPLIVHSHTPKAGIVGMLASKLAGVPIRLHTVAGLPLLVVNGNKRKILDFVEKLTYWCATNVYPNSFGLYNIILENKYTEKNKLKVLAKGSSNGIDTTFFNPNTISNEQKVALKKELKISEKDFVFVFVGRIVKDKGINELITAFKKINSIYHNTKLLLVGYFESNLDPISVESEKEIEINSSILSVGYQKDVRPYFAISNVLTFPSYREGFPNVVMQSCAMELTTIATDINGCNEIIENEKNGLIIPVGNAKALFDKMEFLFLNPDKNAIMAKNSRKNITENYEREYVWNEILKEYKTLVEK